MDLLLAGVAGAFFLAGLVKGVSGMGLPTVALGLLALAMSPAAAAALLVVPSLATNVVQCLGRHLRPVGALLWPMWVGIVLGSVFTPLPDLASAGPSARIGLGLLLVAYCVFGLLRPAITLRLAPGRMRIISFFVGAVTGAVAAATGIFFFPMVVFLSMLGFDKEELVQALGISFVVGSLALAGSLGWGVSWRAASSVPGLLALVSAFAGMAVGARLRHRIPAETFRKLLFWVFGLLGSAMLARELLFP